MAEENQVQFAASSASGYAFAEDGALLVRIPDAAGEGPVSVVTPSGRSAPGPEFEFLGFGRPRVGALTQRQKLLHRPRALAGLIGAPVFHSGTTRSLHSDEGRLQVDEDVTAVLGLPDGDAIVATCARAFGGCDVERPAYSLWRWSPGLLTPEPLFAAEGTIVWALHAAPDDGLFVLSGIDGRSDGELQIFDFDSTGLARRARHPLPPRRLPFSAAAGPFVLGIERSTSLDASTLWVIDTTTGALHRSLLPGGASLQTFGPIAAARLGPDEAPTAIVSTGDGWLARFRLDRLAALADGGEPLLFLDLVNRSSPGGLAIAPEEGMLAATRPETGRVSLVSLDTNDVVASIPAGIEPRTIAFDELARRFYAGDDADNAIEIIDPITHTSLARASTRLGVDAWFSAYVVRGDAHLIAVATSWADAALALDGRTLDVIGPFGRSDGIDAVLPADEGRGWVSGRIGLGLVSLTTGVITALLPPPCEGLAWESPVVDAQGALWMTHSGAYTCWDGSTVESRIVRVALDGSVTERILPVAAAPWLVAHGDGVIATVLPEGEDVWLHRYTAASIAAGADPAARWYSDSSRGGFFLGALPFGERLAAFFGTGQRGEPPEVAWLDPALVEFARVDSVVDDFPAATLPDGTHFVVTSWDGQRVGLLRMAGDVPERLFSTAIGGTAAGLIVAPSGERLLVPVLETDELVVIE